MITRKIGNNIIRGHSDFAIKVVAARNLGIAANGLDEMFKGRGYFYLVDEGPHAEKPEYTQFLFAAWTPLPPPADGYNN